MALLLIVGTGCASTQEVTRAMHDWEEGHTVAYELVRDQNQILEIPGQGTQETPRSTTIGMSVVSTGPYQFIISVTDAEAVRSPTPISGLVGLESAIVLDANGRIVTASGLSDNSYVTATGGSDNSYVTATGGSEQFQERLQGIFLVLPDEPLAAGVSWTRKTTIPFSHSGLDGTSETTDKYRCTGLTSYQDVSAFEIELTSEVSLIGSGNQGGGEMDVTMSGTLKGTLYVDASSGILLSAHQSGEISGMIDMAQMSLPMTLEQTMSISREE